MKSSRPTPCLSLLLLLVLVLSASSCKKDDYRDELTEAGSLYAGEEDRFVNRDEFGTGLEIYHRTNTYTVEEERDLKISLSTSFDNSSIYHYNSARSTLGFSNGSIEYAFVDKQDSSFSCDYWSADSIWHYQTYHEGGSRTCDPPALVGAYTRTSQVPAPLRLGDPIDGRLSWAKGEARLFRSYHSSSITSNLTPFPHYESTTGGEVHTNWGNGNGHFIGIRWPYKSGYRYGYVELGVASDKITLYAIGVSKK